MLWWSLRRIAMILGLSVGLFVETTSAEVRILHDPQGSKRIIVFIHGLWSDPDSAFGAWPELMKTDDEIVQNQWPLSQYSIATISYPASIDSQLSITQIAENLPSEMQDKGILQRYNEIYFVAHSLGGIALQEVLISDYTLDVFGILRKTKAIFFLSTPSQGAPIANFSRVLGRELSGRLAVDLATIDNNTYLQSLNIRWKALIEKTRTLKNLRIFCAVEVRPYGGIVIVPQQNSELNCEPGRTLYANEDHISIARPKNKNAQVYGWVRGRIAHLQLTTTAIPQIPGSPG